jgi:hypothetical protein
MTTPPMTNPIRVAELSRLSRTGRLARSRSRRLRRFREELIAGYVGSRASTVGLSARRPLKIAGVSSMST